MTLSRYILYMFFITMVCWLIWVVVIFQIDPFNAGVLGFIFFYLTLFFALVSGFAVLGLVFRRLFIRQGVPEKQVSLALRQGVLFAILIIGSLIMSSFGTFSIFNTILFIGVLAALEFFFLSIKGQDNNQIKE